MTIELTDDNNSDVTVINGLAFKLCCYYVLPIFTLMRSAIILLPNRVVVNYFLL